MSDTAGSAQIEDVLSSIRRLVAEEADRQVRRHSDDDTAALVGQVASSRPVEDEADPDDGARAVGASGALNGKGAGAGALILTPAFRVDTDPSPDDTPAPVDQDRGDLDGGEGALADVSKDARDDAPAKAEMTVAPAGGADVDPVQESAVADWWDSPASDSAAFQTSSEEDEPEGAPGAEEVALASDPEFDAVTAPAVDVAPSEMAQDPDKGRDRPWNEPGTPAPLEEQADRARGAGDPADEPSTPAPMGGPDTAPAETEIQYDQAFLDAMTPEKGASAAIPTRDESPAEPRPADPFYEDEHSGADNVASLEKHRDAVFELHRMMAQAEAGLEDQVDQATEPRDADVAETVAEPVADDERLVALDESVIDEEGLRDLVAQLVREELKGSLGERITRNVRKLVRREIHRALAARDFE